jgi:DNA-binding transcriptional MerR regulator
MFSIGELSRRTGVKVTTIRFYEQKGLIAHEGRTAGNQRRYGKAGLERLHFIAHARDLGLSLPAVAELIALERQEPGAHEEIHQIAAAHLGDVRNRIARLKRLEMELERIGAACDAKDGVPCGVLSAFADHGRCGGPH